MKLNRKISWMTVGVLSFSLLTSSVMEVLSFRQQYTNALLTGSYGLAYSLRGVVDELLKLGLPLASLEGMDKKLRDVVEQNQYISYAGYADLQGIVLSHTNSELIGKKFADDVMLRSIATNEPLTQLYHRFDGHDYYDITVPVFDGNHHHAALIRLGFRSEIVSDKVMAMLWQVALNYLLAFLLMTVSLNLLMNRFVSRPVMALADHAKKMAAGDYQLRAPYARQQDEIGVLAQAFNQLSAMMARQIEALRDSRDDLEIQVSERTLALAQANITLQRQNQSLKQLVAQQQLSTSVFNNSYEGILVTDANNCIIDVNPAFTRITGYERDEVLGKPPNLLKSGRQAPELYQAMWRGLHTEGYWRGEIWNRRKNGEIYAEMLAIAAVKNEEMQVSNYVAVFSDISLIKAHEQELDRIANYDPLTGLPNRRLLADRLKQALANAKRNQEMLAVCYLDLDGFKPVNDKYGHDAGDQLLIEVSRRLKSCLRGNDTLARLGGDEFVLLMGGLQSDQECSHALLRVLQSIALPVMITDRHLSVSASIGVTLYPTDTGDDDTLLRHADQAMYIAKQQGKNRYYLFDSQQDQQIKDHQQLLQRLAKALQQDEFVFYYQPKVNMIDGEVIGAEALIRWQHPEQGVLAPTAFLDAISGTSLEIELTRWVIETALHQMQTWHAQGLELALSINISANQLLHRSFIACLRGLLQRYPTVATHALELEVLETAAIGDMNRAIDVMLQCKTLGVRFSLDDFGTGYSSLSYFRRLPVDMLKIDQGFVRDMLIDGEDLTIVESVIRLSQAFKRPVIAEGVETEEHARRLIELGCILGQGYGIARPMPAQQLEAWLRQRRALTQLDETLPRAEP